MTTGPDRIFRRSCPSVPASWALWASAFVLGAMVLARLAEGPTPVEPVVFADMAAAAGDVQLMTTDNGNEELLYVIDNREEILYVYGVDNRSRLVLYERLSLPTMFRVMRGRSR